MKMLVCLYVERTGDAFSECMLVAASEYCSMI